MAARDEQQQIGKRKPWVRPWVSACASRWFTAMNGSPRAKAMRLGSGDADDEPADQARSCRRGDAVDLLPAEARLGERLGDETIEQLNMGARRDLGHHAAELGMQRKLRPHQIGENSTPLPLASRRTMAAAVSSQARLDAEDHKVALLWDSSHHASLQGKTGAIEEYDAFPFYLRQWSQELG